MESLREFLLGTLKLLDGVAMQHQLQLTGHGLTTLNKDTVLEQSVVNKDGLDGGELEKQYTYQIYKQCQFDELCITVW